MKTERTDIPVSSMQPGVYDAASITVLSGLEPIRQRPAMYIGSTGSEGLHHLVHEVVENAMDETLAGHCSRILVVLHQDGSCSVEDNGRGIPVAEHSGEGRPACEVVLTTLHAGGKFGGSSYVRSGGLHGVGLSCVNALSAWLVLDVWRDGGHFRQRFSRGKATSELERLEPSARTGTRIHFLPDDQIFSGPVALSFERVHERLQALAFLHPGIRIEIEDRRSERSETLQYDSGLLGYLEHRNRARKAIHAPAVHIVATRGDVEVHAALQWTNAYAEDLCSFVNGITTTLGGTHVTGLKSAIGRAVNEHAKSKNMLHDDNGETLSGLDVLEGLTCILSLRMSSPQFEGQTKAQLSSTGATGIVDAVVFEGLVAFFQQHPGAAANIVGKAVEASRARSAARRASEYARYQEIDPDASREIYQKQFGIRSKNWHESCSWLADQELLEAHAELCQVPSSARLLDVCCGSGIVSASFGDRVAHKTGLDITAEMRALAQTRLDEVQEGSVYAIPFEDGSFDITVTREVLHLLPMPERPLSEVLRVLRPGGQLIVGQTVPYADEDAAWMFRIFKKKQPLFFNNFTAEDYVELLREVGFVDITMKEHFLWESIDLWIDTHETSSLHRHEIKDLYYNAPAEVRAVHPFEILPSGEVQDRWRWCIYSAFKPK